MNASLLGSAAASLGTISAQAHSPTGAPVGERLVDPYDLLDDRIIPLGARSQGAVAVMLQGSSYSLRFVGDETIDYRIDRTHSDFSKGILRITEASSGALLMRGGQMFKYDDQPTGGTWLPVAVPANVAVTLVSEGIENGQVVLVYQHVYLGVTHRIRYEIGIEGKSLRIRTFSLTPNNKKFSNNYHGFHLDGQSEMPNSQAVWIPYMENVGVTFFGGHWFFSSFVDSLWSRGANRQPVFLDLGTSSPKNFDTIRYVRMSDGSINHPVDDTIWVTVSSKIEDTFRDTDNYLMSPHRITANRTAVVRQSGNHGFASVEAQAKKLHGLGFFLSQQYIFDWQYYQTPINDPTYYPPSPTLGTIADMKSLLATFEAERAPVGMYYTFELMDPGYTSDCWVFQGEGGANPNYDATYLLRDDFLVNKVAWSSSTTLSDYCGPGVGHPEELIAVNHQVFYLLREYKLFEERVGEQTLSYIDARHVLPKLDQEAGTDKPNNMRDGFLAQKAFFLLQKALTGGPILGEGTKWSVGRGELELSGYSDGVSRRLAPPDASPEVDWYIMPDYELEVIRPKTLHHGMGLESQYSGFPQTQAAQDAVRCAEICYGHAICMMTNGDVVSDFLQDPEELKAYYQITADLQSQFATAESVVVAYWNGTKFVALKEAIAAGVNFSEPVLRITYDTGLIIYANCGPIPWAATLYGIPFVLEQDSWVAQNTFSGYLNFSAKVGTIPQRFDYVSMPGKYEMIDGRGLVTSFGGVTARDFRIRWSNGFDVTETGLFPQEFTVQGTPPTAPSPDSPDPLPTPLPNAADVSFTHLQGMNGWIYRAYDPKVGPILPTLPVGSKGAPPPAPDGRGPEIPVHASAGGSADPSTGLHPFWMKYWPEFAKFHHYPDLQYHAATGLHYYPANPNVYVGATLMHPSDGEDAVRGWVALAPGNISVTGLAVLLSDTGNGVRVRIRKGFEGPILWQASLNPHGIASATHTLSLSVDDGDLLLFEVGANTDDTGDIIDWAPLVTYL